MLKGIQGMDNFSLLSLFEAGKLLGKATDHIEVRIISRVNNSFVMTTHCCLTGTVLKGGFANILPQAKHLKQTVV